MSDSKKTSEKEKFDPENHKKVEKGPIKKESKSQYGEKNKDDRRLEGTKTPNKD